MRPLLVWMIGFLMASLRANAADQFVYDAHNKRDPFNPLVTSTGAMVAYDPNLSFGDMSLEGVLVDPQGNSAAIINGKIVKKADHVGPYEVDSIAPDHVELLKDGERFTLKLKRGGS